jgi:hypothetical protein
MAWLRKVMLQLFVDGFTSLSPGWWTGTADLVCWLDLHLVGFVLLADQLI